MKYPRILVVGGAGFVGRHLVALLSARGHRVLVPTRRLDRARHLLPLPTVEVLKADLSREKELRSLVANVDAVINLAGVLQGRRGIPYGREFAATHVELPRKIAHACMAAKVPRMVQVSALGVVEGGKKPLPSMYLRSKAAGEQVLRQTPGLQWTILRPSVVFGPDDRFLNMFAFLQRFLPVMAVGRAGTRFAPVYVGDVALALANALENPATFGKTYELGGPETFTLAELIRLSGNLSGHPRPILQLPDWAGRLQALSMEWLPGPTLMSRDNFDSLAVDSLPRSAPAPELGVTPTALTVIAPTWMRAPARYDAERARAGR